MTTAERLTTIAENQQKVYDAGKQSEYDRFWDAYQQNGQRKDYAGAFSGDGWNNDWFKPKYNMIVQGRATGMFQYSLFEGDLAKHLEDLGVRLDTTKATAMHSFMTSAPKITRCPEINTTSAGAAMSSLFSYCSALVTIDKMVVNAKNTFASTFQSCFALANLTIEGEVAASIDLKSCPLSKDSILSVFNALSTTKTGQTATFQKAAVNAAFTNEEWDALVATKKNWTIALA